MAEQAVSTVLERGVSIVVDEAKYLSGVSEKLEEAKRQLLRMQAFLKDLDDKMLKGDTMARNLVSEVREVTYKVEDIIDTSNILRRQSDPSTSINGAILKYVCFPIYLTRLHKLGVRIDSARASMKTIFEDFQTLNIASTAIVKEPHVHITEDDTIQRWRSVQPDSSEDIDVIGFDEQIKQIKEDLLDRDAKHLTVVSIVGPGGAGKSTMAKKVYGFPEVKGNFEVHAWITVSQRVAARHDLLKQIVKRVVPPNLMNTMILRTMGDVSVKKVERIEGMTPRDMVKWTTGEDSDEKAKALEEMTEQELTKLLYVFALSGRYLIVLDDIWSTHAWDIIESAFPNNKNGSRVILTTRNEAIAQHPSARKKVYKPKLLNEEESTLLLLSKALPEYFRDDGDNASALMRKNLEELGKDLAVKCRGLPLALVVLGGYLSRNLDVAEWKRLTSSMKWHDMISTEKVIGAVLDLSYYDMPSHLRSCFMYTTAFPEDRHIDIQVLTSLWIAEGFIPLVRGHTREEVAIKFAAELVRRCMIQVEKRTALSGRIMLIKVHDILRDWGNGRARREGFIKDCHGVEDINASYSDEMVEAYRLAFHDIKNGEIRTTLEQRRTLLYFKLSTNFGSMEGSLLKRFRHLRVLYVEVQASESELRLPGEISLMRYLKFLGFGGNATYYLPASIGDLMSLETLYAPVAIVHDIPGSLWKIPTLAQVYIPVCLGWSMSRWISSQSKMHALVGCVVNNTLKGKQMMEAAEHQIQKNKKPSFSFCCAVRYSHASQTEIVGRCGEVVQFPNILVGVTQEWKLLVLKISCTNLLSTDENILELGRMDSLRVLEIGEQSYIGSLMNCPSGSFPSLERLALHDLAVEDWKIESGSMTRLRELTLCKCPNLTHLPEGLSLLPNLVKLDVIAMPPGCYEQGTIVQELKDKGCMVSISHDEHNFQHLNIPCKL